VAGWRSFCPPRGFAVIPERDNGLADFASIAKGLKFRKPQSPILSDSRLSRCGVDVANGYRESVARVEGLRCAFHTEEDPNHLLNLLFFGATVTYQRRLDSER
jgi:hypothetical protein